MLQSKVTRI